LEPRKDCRALRLEDVRVFGVNFLGRHPFGVVSGGLGSEANSSNIQKSNSGNSGIACSKHSEESPYFKYLQMTKNMQGGAKENFFGGQNPEILPTPQPDLNAEIFTKDAAQNPGKVPGQNPTGGHFFSFNEKEANLHSFQHSRAQNGLQRSPQGIMTNDLSSISSNSDNSTNKHPAPHLLPQKNFPSCSGHILSFQGSTRGDSDQKILNFQGETCDGNSLTNDEKALMMPVVQEELDEERKSSIKEYPDALGDLSPGFDDCRDGECLISGSRLES
jgi:hypothetical protein